MKDENPRKNAQQDTRRLLGERVFQAVVTATSGGLIKIRRLDQAAADGQFYPAAAGLAASVSPWQSRALRLRWWHGDRGDQGRHLLTTGSAKAMLCGSARLSYVVEEVIGAVVLSARSIAQRRHEFARRPQSL